MRRSCGWTGSLLLLVVLMGLATWQSGVHGDILIHSPDKYKDQKMGAAYLKYNQPEDATVTGEVFVLELEDNDTCQLKTDCSSKTGIAYVLKIDEYQGCQVLSNIIRLVQDQCKNVEGLLVGVEGAVPGFHEEIELKKFYEDISDIVLPVANIEPNTFELLDVENEPIVVSIDLYEGDWLYYQDAPGIVALLSIYCAIYIIFSIIMIFRIIQGFRVNIDYYKTIPCKLLVCLLTYSLCWTIVDALQLEFRMNNISVTRATLGYSGTIAGMGSYLLLLVGWGKVARLLKGKRARDLEITVLVFYVCLFIFITLATILRRIMGIPFFYIVVNAAGAVACLSTGVMFFYYGGKLLNTLSHGKREFGIKTDGGNAVQRRMTILVFISVILFFCFIIVLFTEIFAKSFGRYSFTAYIVIQSCYRVLSYLFFITLLLTLKSSGKENTTTYDGRSSPNPTPTTTTNDSVPLPLEEMKQSSSVEMVSNVL